MSDALELRGDDLQLPEAAQPGELALGELTGRGDSLLAHLLLADRALEVFPNLAVAHAAHARHSRAQAIAAAQRLHFVDQAGLQHGIEARGDAAMQLVALLGREREGAQVKRQRSAGAALQRRERLAGEAPYFERALDALRIVERDPVCRARVCV